VVNRKTSISVHDAVEVLFANRHTLPNDVLRSLANIWICASAARFGEPYETYWWDADSPRFRDHDVPRCEAGLPSHDVKNEPPRAVEQEDWRNPPF
jgi:hypothetical protein